MKSMKRRREYLLRSWSWDISKVELIPRVIKLNSTHHHGGGGRVGAHSPSCCP